MRIAPGRHPSRRGVTPIIATIFLLGLTVASGTVLWAFSPRLPSAPTSIEYEASGGVSVPAWGDGSDCKNVNGSQQCLTLPAITIVITSFSPSAIRLADLTFYLICNGSIYLQAPFPAMEWVPGSAGTPSANAPQLGHCGTYTPPKAAFNRLGFFQQIDPGATLLQPGDTIVVVAHTFTSFKDDDFHGAPTWCFTVLGACSILLAYGGPSPGIALNLPLTVLNEDLN
jgi:hypothetical protein